MNETPELKGEKLCVGPKSIEHGIEMLTCHEPDKSVVCFRMM